MKKKQILLIALALILVCSISVMGTLAFLTAKQDGQKAVVNTFVAAGGGNIIDEDTDKPGPVIPGDDEEDDIQLQDGFYLVETKANYADAKYTLSTVANDFVLTNTYDKVVPSMSIPKNPKLTVDLAADIDAYVFVKVTDTTAKNLVYTVANGWSKLTIEGLAANETVYVYTVDGSSILTGTDAVDLDSVSILAGDTVTAAAALTDADTSDEAEGMQLGELTFEAYACQAGGFDDAEDAFTDCFVSTAG